MSSTSFGGAMLLLAFIIIVLGFRLVAKMDAATRPELVFSGFALGFVVAGFVFSGMSRWWRE